MRDAELNAGDESARCASGAVTLDAENVGARPIRMHDCNVDEEPGNTHLRAAGIPALAKCLGDGDLEIAVGRAVSELLEV